MGNYIDWKDVADRYPNVPNRADTVEGNNFYVVGAEAEVNAAASSKYTVPFVPGSVNVPPLIRDVTIDLAYWKAIGWQNAKLSKIQRDDIDRRLAGIKDGSLPLATGSGTIAQTGLGFAWSTQEDIGEPRTSFGVDAPENWSVSSSWQDSFDQARVGDGGSSGGGNWQP